MEECYDSLISLLLPGFILDLFEMKGVRKEDDIFHLDLEEVNILPKVSDGGKLQSKGAFPTITVQDFPYSQTQGVSSYQTLSVAEYKHWKGGLPGLEYCCRRYANNRGIRGFFKRNQSIPSLIQLRQAEVITG